MDWIRNFLKNNREVVSYLFFGVCTTLVSWLSYSLFVKVFLVSIEVSNVVSWVCAVLFAFITNKIFVFESKSFEKKTFIKEFVSFITSRLFTGIIEIIGVPFLVRVGLSQTIFGISGMLSKIVVSIIVIILNYIFSKLFVFKINKGN